MEWFKAGGWGMYPILIVGLITLGGSAFYAARGDARIKGSLDALSKSLVWFIATAFASDVITVCYYLSGESKHPAPPPEQFWRIAVQGLGESLTTITMGGAFLSLIWLFMAVGQRRVDQRA